MTTTDSQRREEATARTFTADEVRVLMRAAWFEGYEWIGRDKDTTPGEDTERLLTAFEAHRG